MKRCWALADSAAGSDGFVALRDLSKVTGCGVVSRPLLAEAVITRTREAMDSWVVLVNSEIHRFTDEDWELESAVSSLAIRTRNTIAHEIAHSVAVDLCGVDLVESGTLAERLEEIEALVETVSPLLLISKSKLENSLSAIRTTSSALSSLVRLRGCMGVSSDIFLQALRTYSKFNRCKFVTFDALLNSAFGVLHTRGKRRFSIRSSGVFANYHSVAGCLEYRTIARSRETSWEIEEIVESDGSLTCRARSNAFLDGEMLAEFEIERVPDKGRHALFFRLGSEVTRQRRTSLPQKTTQAGVFSSEWVPTERFEPRRVKSAEIGRCERTQLSGVENLFATERTSNTLRHEL